MTAEVAIMNKNALVFAADSATTVTSWKGGEKETRFFKGANKLFQLSALHPVALMINGSAELQGMPWEIVVKEFRTHLANNHCDKLAMYGEQFFNFVRGHKGLFTDELRQNALMRNLVRSSLVAVRMVDAEIPENSRPTVDEYSALVTKLLDGVRAATPKAPVTRPQVEAAVAAHLTETTHEIANDLEFYEARYAQAAGGIAELAIRMLMTNYLQFLDATGIVIGGYGNEEFFPSFEVYECFGFLNGELVVTRESEKCRAVTSRATVAIESFATQDMIDTFQTGVAPNVFLKIAECTEKCLVDFAGKLRDIVAPQVALPDIATLVIETCESHQDEWMRTAMAEHYRPLAQVIGSLPMLDMAALAKSLIELQSLKERVTVSTESVSGPIDVAAISKHDGFVWIERKHYFRPELNPRFFHRQSILMNS